MTNNMTEGNPAKSIFYFTMPMLIGNIFQQAYSMVDSIVVGWAVGPGAVAAVGASFGIMFFILSFVFGISMGISVVISQFFGAKKMDELKHAYGTSLICMAGIGIILSIVGVVIARPFLELLRTPADIMEDAFIYLTIVFSGTLFSMLYNGMSSILRGLGNSKLPLVFLIISSLLNIVLDVLFVVSLNMGVAGVAVATVLSQLIAGVLCAWYCYKSIPELSITREHLHINKEYIKKILGCGMPSGFQQSIVSVGMMAIQGLLNSFGTDAVAGFSGAGRIDAFATLPLMSFGMSISTYAGQNIGAKKFDRIKKGLHAGLLMSGSITAVLSVVILLFGKPLMRSILPTANDFTIETGALYLSIAAMFYVVFAVMFQYMGVLRGAGDMNVALLGNVLALVIRIVVAYSLAPHFGLAGVFWALPIGWFGAISVPIIRYYTGGWKKKAIV